MWRKSLPFVFSHTNTREPCLTTNIEIIYWSNSFCLAEEQFEDNFVATRFTEGMLICHTMTVPVLQNLFSPSRNKMILSRVLLLLLVIFVGSANAGLFLLYVRLPVL